MKFLRIISKRKHRKQIKIASDSIIDIGKLTTKDIWMFSYLGNGIDIHGVA